MTASRDDIGGGASRSTDPAAGSSAATDVSLREMFSTMLGYERRGTYMLVGFLGVMGAFAWREIQVHLSNLNHENARVAAVSERSVSSDTYAANEQQRKSEALELIDWRKDTDKKLNAAIGRDEFQRETKIEKRAVTGTGWQWVGGFVGLIVLALALYAALHTARPVEVPAPTVTVTTPK